MKLATYEVQQEVSQTQMKAEVKERVDEVAAGLRNTYSQIEDLYTTASVAVGTLD